VHFDLGDYKSSLVPSLGQKVQFVRQIQEILKKNSKDVQVQKATVKQTDQGVVITIADSLMFESGRAEIRAEALPILENLAEIMAANASVKEVRVQGHTDNVPINSALFPSNWELSAVRAAMVTRAMTELYGMQPEKISAVGFGEFRPVADNLTPENREKNRRVELLILTNETDEDL